MVKIVFIAVLFLNIIQFAAGISCYSSSSYGNKPKSLHHIKFCSSIFSLTSTYTGFGGGTTKEVADELKDGPECRLEAYRNGKTWEEVYKCVCFTSYCNFPLTFDEFERRNYTIKPSWPTIEPAL